MIVLWIPQIQNNNVVGTQNLCLEMAETLQKESGQTENPELSKAPICVK